MAKIQGSSFILPTGTLPAVFTIQDITEEQNMIRQTMQEFMIRSGLSGARDELLKANDWRETKRFLRELAELGLLGAEISEEYGGQGLDKVSGAIIAEEINRQGSFTCTFLAHTGIATLPIRYFGTQEQKQTYLPKMVNGEWFGAYSLTEVNAGSDAKSVRTTAVKTEQGFVLNGEKIFVTNGGFADVFVVFARLEGIGLTAFIVERNFPGVAIGPEEHKMGMHGSSTVSLVFNNALIPTGNLLGEPGKGFKIAVNILNLGRFKLAAAALGGARVALELSLGHATERKQFDVPIISFGAVRHKLAHMASQVYAMESVIYRTAGHLEEAISGIDQQDSRSILKGIEEFAVECSIAKVYCSEALDDAVDENVQIHGGLGFCEGLPERMYRDSRINRIFEGTNEINRLLVVGMVLKRAMAGELPLMAAGKKLLNEAISLSSGEPEDDIERLKFYLDGAKKAIILVSGAAWEKFGFKLEEHQQVIMALADCLINVYVMESALAALAKNRDEHSKNLAQLVFDEKLFEIESLVKHLLAMCAEGDTQRTLNSMAKRFLKFTTVNTEELTEKIVQHLIGA